MKWPQLSTQLSHSIMKRLDFLKLSEFSLKYMRPGILSTNLPLLLCSPFITMYSIILMILKIGKSLAALPQRFRRRY